MARVLSLPVDRDEFNSGILSSYRSGRACCITQSATAARPRVFHVAEGGLPIPDDKLAVPKPVFARLLEAALQPPPELLRLPFTSTKRRRRNVLFHCCSAGGLSRRCPDSRRKNRWRCAFSRPATSSATSISSKDLRQRRRSVPAGKRRRTGRANIGPATPAASSSRRI